MDEILNIGNIPVYFQFEMKADRIEELMSLMDADIMLQDLTVESHSPTVAKVIICARRMDEVLDRAKEISNSFGGSFRILSPS